WRGVLCHLPISYKWAIKSILLPRKIRTRAVTG
ncbi:GTP pyrophosphokinase, partial [Haemophilus influenzae]